MNPQTTPLDLFVGCLFDVLLLSAAVTGAAYVLTGGGCPVHASAPGVSTVLLAYCVVALWRIHLRIKSAIVWSLVIRDIHED